MTAMIMRIMDVLKMLLLTMLVVLMPIAMSCWGGGSKGGGFGGAHMSINIVTTHGYHIFQTLAEPMCVFERLLKQDFL